LPRASGQDAKSFDNRAEAQAWLDEITAARVTGTYLVLKAGLISVADLYAKWLGTQGHLKATTVATRKYTWSAHVEHRWSRVALADVKTSGVRSWVQDMVAAGAGPATVENALSVLRQVLAVAVEDKRLARNPAGSNCRRVSEGHVTRPTPHGGIAGDSGGANPKAVQTMLGHQSAALTLDTYADLFPGDLELVSAALDQARQAALEATADQLRTGTQQSP
jgi:hypothetical protein